MTRLHRLDHVAVAVHDTDQALEYFRDRLGLPMVWSERNELVGARLTYLDAGNIMVQLVEPLDASSPVATHLATEGEGLHHLCFAVDDVPGTAAALADPDAPSVLLGSGRGRPSAFVPGGLHHGVRVECTASDPPEVALATSEGPT